MQDTLELPTFSHDVFISYSRKDETFAARLKESLEDYTPPRDLNAPQRHLNVFRDKSDFTGSEYFQAIERHLMGSQKLIVLCSPEARQSTYVNDEIRRFVRTRGAENVISILVSGKPNNEAKAGEENEMSFPDALCEALKMPLAIGYLGFNPKKDKFSKGIYYGAWYRTLAEIYGLSLNEIEQRDKKRQARTRKIRLGIVSGVIASLLALLIWALVSRDIAVKNERETHQLLYVANINLAQRALDNRNRPAARELLSVFLPKTDHGSSDDVRSFPWYLLWYLRYRETNLQHSKGVMSIAFSPNGKALATGGWGVDGGGGTAKLWDVKTGKELVSLKLDTYDSVGAVAFSLDGKILVTGDRLNNIKLWDATSYKELATLTGHSDFISSVAISPDNKTLASGSWDHTIKLWDMVTRKELATLKGHTDKVESVAFTPDSKILVTGSLDKTSRLWDLTTYQEIVTLTGHARGESVEVAISPDGKMLATSGGTNDGTIKLWDIVTHKEIASLSIEPNYASLFSVVFSPDGRMLASAGSEIYLWDIKTYKKLAIVGGGKPYFTFVRFSPDGKTLAAADSETVKLWDVATILHKDKVTLETGHSSSVESVIFSPDGKKMATGSHDSVKLWNIVNREHLSTIPGVVRAPSGMAFSPNGKFLATGTEGSAIMLWDVESRKEITTLSGHRDSIYSVAFSSDGRKLASTDSNGTTAKIWDIAS